jgi:hypothetical protein
VQTKTGDDANSVENALVINLGDGTSNSGLNRIIGVLSQNGADYGLGGAAAPPIETGPPPRFAPSATR